MAEPQSQSAQTTAEGESSSEARESSTQLDIELFDAESHGGEVLSWWKGWGKNAPTLSMLASVGYVVKIDGKPMAAAWAYFGNSDGLAYIGFPCTNPGAGRRKRLQALGIAIRTAESFLKSLGKSAVVVNVDNRALTKMLVGAGFELLTPHDFLIKRV